MEGFQEPPPPSISLLTYRFLYHPQSKNKTSLIKLNVS